MRASLPPLLSDSTATATTSSSGIDVEVDVDTLKESLRLDTTTSTTARLTSQSFRIDEEGEDEVSSKGSEYWAGDDADNAEEVQAKLAAKKAEKVELERQTLARRGTVAVTRLRLLALVVLVGTALLVCLGVYFYTRRDEQEDFEYVFESSAERVLQSFHASVTQLLAGMDAMSVSITSFAMATNATFPFVTVPDMALRGANIRVLTKSVAANYYPLIETEEQRVQWEAFAKQKVVDENLPFETFLGERIYAAKQDAKFDLEPAEFNMPSPEDFPMGANMLEFSPRMFGMDGQVEPDQTPPYLPFYQTSPSLPAPSLPNLNILSFPPLASGVTKVMETNMAYLSSPILEPPIIFDLFLQLGQYRHDTKVFEEDALTPLMYPIFNNFTEGSRTLVGLCVATIYWRLHFEDILPNNANGIVVVLANNNGNSSNNIDSGNTESPQTFTYLLNGPVVEYLGMGDLHDPQFDKYEISADISKYLQSRAGVETEGYVAVPLTEEGAQYSLHVYPSTEMRDEYVTNQPVVFAMIVAAVFVFTAGVFLAYNALVERRQREVVNTAVKTAAVVSNLFPEDVKEQIMNESSVNHTTAGIGNEGITEKKRGERSGNVKNWRRVPSEPAIPVPSIVAKAYPSVTIMFAGKYG